MSEKKRQLNIRINGNFAKYVDDLSVKWDLDVSSVIRTCVKRVYDQEFPQAQPAPPPPAP